MKIQPKLLTWADRAVRLLATSSVLIVGGVMTPCAEASEPAPRRPSGRAEATLIPVSTPEDQGMDSEMLAEMVDGLFDSREDYRPHRMIILRHGHIILDITFYPFAKGVRHDVASACKIVPGLLIGIAIDQGFIGSVDDQVLSYFPDREIANRDARKEAMTIANLLAQRSGIDFSRADEMGSSPDWVQWILDQPMISEPGEDYEYRDQNVHLANGVLAQATGMTPIQFARLFLFGPLHISDVRWQADPQGINNGGYDLQLLPLDFAKIGSLFLTGGSWRGTQIVSADWIDLSTTTYPGPPVSNWPPQITTGFHWIIHSDLGVMDAAGSAGQIIRLAPEDDLAMVVVAGGGPAYDMCGDNGALVDWLLPQVRQAIHSSAPLPANPQGVARLTSMVEEAAEAAGGPPQPVPPLPAVAYTISGQRFLFETGNPLAMEWVSLSFPGGDEALVEYQTAEQGYVAIRTGLDDVVRVSPGYYGLPFASKGRWVDDNSFVVEFDQVPLWTRFDIEFSFGGGAVTITAQELACGGPVITIVGSLQSQ